MQSQGPYAAPDPAIKKSGTTLYSYCLLKVRVCFVGFPRPCGQPLSSRAINSSRSLTQHEDALRATNQEYLYFTASSISFHNARSFPLNALLSITSMATAIFEAVQTRVPSRILIFCCKMRLIVVAIFSRPCGRPLGLPDCPGLNLLRQAAGHSRPRRISSAILFANPIRVWFAHIQAPVSQGTGASAWPLTVWPGLSLLCDVFETRCRRIQASRFARVHLPAVNNHIDIVWIDLQKRRPVGRFFPLQ